MNGTPVPTTDNDNRQLRTDNCFSHPHLRNLDDRKIRGRLISWAQCPKPRMNFPGEEFFDKDRL
jgi:hypothetical protein